MVTDYDCWHPNHDDVTVEQIIKVLLANADKACTLVKHAVPRIAADAQACDCGCRSALQYALITSPEARSAELTNKLQNARSCRFRRLLKLL